MKLGLELVTGLPCTLRLGTFFETWISTPTGTVRRSLGRDEYHLDLALASGRRLAATGRTHVCQLDLEDAGLGPNQARPAVLAEAETEPGTPVIWGIRTNLFLSLPALIEGATALLIRDGTEPFPFRFDDKLLVAEATAPGRYIIDISAYLLP
ncbi:MAG TPA: hypothetical protein VNT01_10455 [Symbiobacteriaceae bacterium]|nr:hypothetical protein [Symbiobacteriaceae bacterium]